MVLSERKRDPLKRREVRAKRIRRSMRKLGDAPATIDNPFFADLRARWPHEPTMARPVSQLCTSSQFEEDDYLRICAELKIKPTLRRKQWEFIYIIRSLEYSGIVGPNARGLAFGVGREKLPALFVSKGCQITATDLPVADATGEWAGGLQHTDTVDNLFYPRIVSREAFDGKIDFRPVNMNAIPDDLVDYDFCWSSCALEHLGSLEHGFNFIRNSLKCLRPGGISVHTTEFNLGSATVTLENGPSVVFRETDLSAFQAEMAAAGHTMASLNLNPGGRPTDLMIDRDRNSDIHLRLYVRHQILATSFGLCIRKAA